MNYVGKGGNSPRRFEISAELVGIIGVVAILIIGAVAICR